MKTSPLEPGTCTPCLCYNLIAMEKLSKPPLVAAALRITFLHNLKVSELRSAYYEDIKDTFPHIQFPDVKQISYDFSDCHFWNREAKTQVRIATNYFALETVDYKNVDEFWLTFQSVFKKFVDRMGVREVVGITIEFLNKISIDAVNVGTNFGDYFTLGLISNAKLSKEFLTLDGAAIFRVGESLLQIDIRPVQNPQTRLYDTLDFKITFLSNKQWTVDEQLAGINTIFVEGHKHIEDVFRTSLTEKYLQIIK